jgi:uracil-DNA glycosylase family 4
VFIGEQPGRDERIKGKPFVGKAGREFNEHYLKLAGLFRDDIYITNTVKCWHANSGELPPENVIESCRNYHLSREINEIKPEVVVTMGVLAARNVPGMQLEYEHGLPVETKLWGHKCTVFPMYHPALGMHKTDRMQTLRDDFKRLKSYMNGTLPEIVDQHPEPFYSLVTHAAPITCGLPIAIDTEDDPDTGLWCATISQRAGRGYMIQPGSVAWQEFLWRMATWDAPIIMHNMVHDVPMLESAGVHMPVRRIYDTMVEAYHRCYLQKSLKYLAYRLLGVRMTEYMDVVVPHSTNRLVEYLENALVVDFPKPPKVKVMKDGQEKDKQPHGLNTKLKRFFTDYCKDPTIDAFDRIWNSWSEEERDLLRRECGPIPKASIKWVPEAEAIDYACRDARVTLELWDYFRVHEGKPIR